VVNLETTGGSAIYDRIVEVAIKRLEGGEIVDRYEHALMAGRDTEPDVVFAHQQRRCIGGDSHACRSRRR
jgi:DNA polymerase III epsilon subunit-like protein